jgi:hypothetical protein
MKKHFRPYGRQILPASHFFRRPVLSYFAEFSAGWQQWCWGAEAYDTGFGKTLQILRKQLGSTSVEDFQFNLHHSGHILVFNIPVLSRLGVYSYENSATGALFFEKMSQNMSGFFLFYPDSQKPPPSPYGNFRLFYKSWLAIPHHNFYPETEL